MILHGICCGNSVPFIRPWNVDRGLELTAQGSPLCAPGSSCTGCALHTRTAYREGTIPMCVSIRTALTHGFCGSEEVSLVICTKAPDGLAGALGVQFLKREKHLSVNVFGLWTFMFWPWWLSSLTLFPWPFKAFEFNC